jgi:hypothetical protein
MATPKKLEDFPYTSTFSAVLKPLISEERDKYLAVASLKQIAKYIPSDVDSSTNVDLLPFACNAFVANRVNKNDDVADSATSVHLAKLFTYKPVNIEHNRSKVMGVILSHAFTKFGSDDPLTEKQALASTEPFNVTLGGVLWRIVDPDTAKLIEDSSDPASKNFESVAASWEVGFMDYALATIDGKSKNLSDAELITDADQIKKLTPYLTAFKGKGSVEGGKRLYRVVGSGALPFGIGLTENPAAEVNGVATQKSKGLAAKKTATASEENGEVTTEVTPQVASETTPQISQAATTTTQEADASLQENQETSSQTNKNNVIKDNSKIMAIKITKIEDLTDENLKQIVASDLSQWVKDQLAAANQAYTTEKSKLETSVQTATAKQTELQATVEKLTKDVADVTKNYNELKAKEDARVKQDRFNGRMATLDQDFNLTDEIRAAITTEVADLDDTAYATHKKKLDVLLAANKKTAQAAATTVTTAAVAAAATTTAATTTAAATQVAAQTVQVAVASATTDAQKAAVDTALANASQDTTKVPGAAIAAEPQGSLAKFSKAFGKDQWISDVKLTD